MNAKSLFGIRRLVASVLVFASGMAAAANMDDLMSNMFNNVLVNGTPGGVYETQTRGVIAGPSLYARSRVSNVQLAQWTLPRITAGCSGIDAWAGAFSFISKDQLVNFLRNIAANAVPYAFKVALSALCNGCEKHMQTLVDMANLVNRSNLNSCNIAKALVDSTGMEDALKSISSSWAVKQGACEDADYCNTQIPESPAKRVKDTFPALTVEFTGNVAWKALTKSDYSGWFNTAFSGASGTFINEIVMSFTGSYIKRFEQGAPGDPGEDAKWMRLPPTIDSVDAFLSGGEVQVYNCGVEVLPDECLNPTITTVTMRGMRGMVRDMIMGPSGDNGILFKISERDASSLTNAEKVFIERAPGSVATHLVRLSTNLDSAAAYVDSVQEFIASQLVYNLLTEMLTGVQVAAAGERKDLDVNRFMQDLAGKRMEVMAAMQVQAARMQSVETNFNIANHIRASLNTSQSRSITISSSN